MGNKITAIAIVFVILLCRLVFVHCSLVIALMKLDYSRVAKTFRQEYYRFFLFLHYSVYARTKQYLPTAPHRSGITPSTCTIYVYKTMIVYKKTLAPVHQGESVDFINVKHPSHRSGITVYKTMIEYKNTGSYTSKGHVL